MLLTEEQDKILKEKARQSGFCYKSEYVRFVLFMHLTLADKVNEIYKKVVEK